MVGQLGLNIIKTTVQYSSFFLTNILKFLPNISNRGIWICGPIIHTDNENDKLQIIQEILKAVDLICEKYNLVYAFGFSPPYDLSINDQYRDLFKKNGYLVHPSITYLADLSKSLETLWDKVSKKTKGDVSRAARRGISVKQIESFEQLEDYIKLHNMWLKTKGLTLSKSAFNIEKIWNNIKSGSEIFFLAYQNNEIISGLRLVQFNDILYTYQVISSYSNDNSLGGTLLTWKSIEWAKKQNFKYYDFSGGSGGDNTSKENNLLFYKKKWGGNKIDHNNLLKIRKKTKYRIFYFFESMLVKYHSFKGSR